MSSMSLLSWVYALPAVVFVAAMLVWLGRGEGGRVGWWRFLGLLPVVACYGTCGFLLVSGGCQRDAHVKLEGVEVDLADGQGKGRVVVIGGDAEDGGPAPVLRVPGWPADALRVVTDGNTLRLVPGPGYGRDLLVRSGGKIIPVSDAGVPRLVGLVNGDEIRVGAEAGGGDCVTWTPGNGKYDLTVPAAGEVWLGGDARGMARAPGYPPQVMALRRDGKALVLKKGPGFPEAARVRADGRPVVFDRVNGEARVAWHPGKTLLELSRQDPLAGVIRFKTGGVMQSRVEIAREGKTLQTPFRVRTGKDVTAGGGVADLLSIRGLPPGAIAITAGEGGVSLHRQAAVPGMAERMEIKTGASARIGPEHAPWGGAFEVTTVDPVAGEAGVFDITCSWLPNSDVVWKLPNRRVTVPMVRKDLEVMTRLNWEQRVYPLAVLAGRETGMGTCLVAGAPGLEFNQTGLLVTDPGVTVVRGGREIIAPAAAPGVLANGAELEFLLVRTVCQQGVPNSTRSPMQAATTTEWQGVDVLRKLGAVSLAVRTGDAGRKVPVMRVDFERPETGTISLGELKRDAKQNPDIENPVAFGLNEPDEFASLPHQVRFGGLTRWFRGANGEVEMGWRKLKVQDDYRRQEVGYGEIFTVGGPDRLRMRVDLTGVPWGVLAWLAAAAVAGLVMAAPWTGRAWGAALFFGISFLTCSRILFGQAVAVNVPHDPTVVAAATKVALALPVILSVVLAVAGRFAQGAPGRLLEWLGRRGYLFVSVVAGTLTAARMVLLMAGFKEGLPVGGSRLALSVLFVPAYLVLAGCCIALVLDRCRGEVRVREVWKFAACGGWLMFCQVASGLLVSDLGTFVFVIPQTLALCGMGVWLGIRGSEHGSRTFETWPQLAGWLGGVGVLCLPLALILLVLLSPRLVVERIPDLQAKLDDPAQIATGSTLLRVLQFVDKEYLVNLGTDAAERIAQDHAIMENYSRRGMAGQGYLQVDVIPAKRITALNDNVAAVYVFGQFGVMGGCAVAVAYLAVALAGLAACGRWTGWTAALCGMVFGMTSLYMLGANWGFFPFTGRNLYMLGLNSLGDVLESVILLGLLAFGLGLARHAAENGGKISAGGLPEEAVGDA